MRKSRLSAAVSVPDANSATISSGSAESGSDDMGPKPSIRRLVLYGADQSVHRRFRSRFLLPLIRIAAFRFEPVTARSHRRPAFQAACRGLSYWQVLGL